MSARVALAVFVLGGLALPAHAESPCGVAIREAFDRAGRAASGAPDAKALAQLEEQLHAHPDRCAPGDYAVFIQRYAALLTVIATGGLTDSGRQLAAEMRSIAPRRISPSGYEPAFRAFLAARAQLVAHLPREASAELLTLFDEVRPLEILPSVALGRDRDGVIQGLAEIRRHLALGEVADADAQAEELLRALQSEPTAADGGAPTDAGR